MKLLPAEKPIIKRFAETMFKYCHFVLREGDIFFPKYLEDARLMIVLMKAILYLVQVTVLAEMKLQGIDKF